MITLTIGITISIIVICIAYIMYRRKYNKLIPKTYKSPTFNNNNNNNSDYDNIRNAYKFRKVPSDIDDVIIGTGIGGLYLGALLSRLGRKVLCLEQHYIAGGCMHCFEDKGFVFDTGIHYVGRVEKYGELLKLVSLPGDEVKFKKLGTEENGYVYDEIRVGNLPAFKFRAGKENFLNDLIKQFPNEEDGIRKYVDLCVKCNKDADTWFFSKCFASITIQKIFNYLAGSRFKKYASMCVDDVIRVECGIKDPVLYATLIGQFGNYGCLPTKASFFIHAGIVSHYLNGAYYPIGGPDQISKALTNTIVHCGGKVLVKAKVNEILIQNNKVVGVAVNSNMEELIYCKNVITACGAEATLNILKNSHPSFEKDGSIPWANAVRCTASNENDNLKQGISHMSAFVGLEGTNEDLQLRSANQWCLGVDDDTNPDIERNVINYYNAGANSKEGMMFMGFPSCKDPTYQDRHPNRSACCIISEAPIEWFDKYRGNGKSGKRFKMKEIEKEYEEYKEHWLKRNLEKMYELFPKTKGKVIYKNIGSPLSNEYYLGRSASYGLDPDTSRFSSKPMELLRPKIEGLEGMWMVGQDVATAGWAGALSSALMTSMAMVGYGFMDLIVYDRNIIDDLMTLPRLPARGNSGEKEEEKKKEK